MRSLDHCSFLFFFGDSYIFSLGENTRDGEVLQSFSRGKPFINTTSRTRVRNTLNKLHDRKGKESGEKAPTMKQKKHAVKHTKQHNTSRLQTTTTIQQTYKQTISKMTESHDVQLAIYDLSHGMARSLSAQFLGPDHALDIIPHTGIIVFGREFFFGGGIQSESPQQFRQMMGIRPVQVLSLGRTTISKAQFEQWCREVSQNGRYTMASYDLLQRNCNNFSHDAAVEGLKLPKGVPDWILDVPRRFLSSPMGQMVRPMLENMQVTGGGSSVAPFANAPTSNFHSNAIASSPAANPQTVAPNPWANIPSATAEQTTKKPSSSSSSSSDGTSSGTTAATKNDATPLLDSFHKPLISSDSKTVALCVKKMLEVVEDDKDKQQILENTSNVLSSSGSLDKKSIQQASEVALGILRQPDCKIITFVLMFLRVLILQEEEEESTAKECLDWIETQLSTNTASLSSHAARAMAWTCLSNAASLSWWNLSSEALVTETALMDLSIESQPRAEVRQSVAAFLYNMVLKQQNYTAATKNDTEEGELPDVLVSILCATMESIGEEVDATTRLRRLLVAARILVPKKTVHAAAKSLMQDLGFIQELVHSKASSGNADDAKKCQSLAREVVTLLQGE